MAAKQKTGPSPITVDKSLFPVEWCTRQQQNNFLDSLYVWAANDRAVKISFQQPLPTEKFGFSKDPGRVRKVRFWEDEEKSRFVFILTPEGVFEPSGGDYLGEPKHLFSWAHFNNAAVPDPRHRQNQD